MTDIFSNIFVFNWTILQFFLPLLNSYIAIIVVLRVSPKKTSNLFYSVISMFPFYTAYVIKRQLLSENIIF